MSKEPLSNGGDRGGGKISIDDTRDGANTKGVCVEHGKY